MGSSSRNNKRKTYTIYVTHTSDTSRDSAHLTLADANAEMRRRGYTRSKHKPRGRPPAKPRRKRAELWHKPSYVDEKTAEQYHYIGWVESIQLHGQLGWFLIIHPPQGRREVK